MQYLIVFSISVFFLHIAEKSKVHFSIGRITWNSEVIYILLASIGPVLLGTFRSLNIGTDNWNYFSYFSKMHLAVSFSEAIDIGRFEVGFDLLAFLVSRLSNSYNLFCFFTTALTVFVMLYATWYMKSDISPTVTFGGFLFLFYCQNYNLVRQGIAIAFVFLSFAFLSKKNYKGYFVCEIIAVLFHSTSIIALLAFGVYKYIKSPKNRTVKIIVIVFLVCTIVYFWKDFLNLSVHLSFVDDNYAEYSSFNNFAIPLKQLVTFFPMVFIGSTYYKLCSVNNVIYSWVYVLTIIGYIMSILGGVWDPISRIGLFFLYASIIVFGIIAKTLSGKTRLTYIVLLTIYYLVFWYYYVCTNGYGYERPVYPYYSIFME